MALIKCPECGKEGVSDTAIACPNCGFAIREFTENLAKAAEEKRKAEEHLRIQQEIEQKEAEDKAREAEEKKRREEARQKLGEDASDLYFMTKQYTVKKNWFTRLEEAIWSHKLVSLIVIVLIILGVRYVMTSSTYVPDVAYKTPSMFIEEIQSKAKKVQVHTYYEESDEVAEGLIIRSVPASGEKIKNGSVVDIYVSRPNTAAASGVEVPNLIHDTVDEAKETLTKLGFVPKIGGSEYSGIVEKEHVLKTIPEHGKRIEKGSTVELIISQGEKPDNMKSASSTDSSKDADELTIKALSQTYNHEDILRNPDSFKNLNCKVSGTVSQTFEGIRDTIYIKDSSGNIWGCKYSYKSGDTHMLDGDKVTVYGILNGTSHAYNALGDQVTFPYVNVKYYEIN